MGLSGAEMAPVAAGPLKFKVTGGDSSSSNPSDAVIFAGISLILGVAARHIFKGTRVPYTVALLILGIGLGSLEYGTKHGLGKIGHGIRLWANIDADLLLAVFLPPILFESSFTMDVHQIKRCMVQMIFLAGPGVIISTFCLGSALKLTFPYGWSWKMSLLVGGLLSATDPVAVVALLKDLGANKKLSTIVEGESLMNDGISMVIYQLFYRMVFGQSSSWGAGLRFFIQASVGAVGIGIALGIASVLWSGFIFNDTVIEIALTLAVSYIAYFMAQEWLGVSGILTVMTLGMFHAFMGATAFKGNGQKSLHHFWEMIAYVANTLIFILSGIIIAEGVLSNDIISENHGKSWGYLILLFVFVQISRVIVVGALYPFLWYFGDGLNWKEVVVLVWSGLRGPVSLSLSLLVKQSSGNSFINSETGTLFLFFTGGIVFLTVVVNGSTTQFLLHFLDMDKLSATKRPLVDSRKYEMLNRALEVFRDLGDDEELGPVDWPTVRRYIKSINDVEEELLHPHCENDNTLDPMNLKDTRLHLLNSVQTAYLRMLDEGRITLTIANILIQSVDEAMNLMVQEPLCDWKGLRGHVQLPSCYKFLQMSICPRNVAMFFNVERLESACYICAAFLRSHRLARRQLHDYVGNSEVASIVISESEAEGEEAREFLDKIRINFPQILHVVKTRQVTYSVLSHLCDDVTKLEEVGLLREMEMIHLRDSFQADLKRLIRGPPLLNMPEIHDLVKTHPFLGALPFVVREKLVGSTREMVKLRGTTLYVEGTKSNGIWLILNGVVKLESNSLGNKHSILPTFSHGSTLGLYEMLTDKPCIYGMVTESVVLCFFIEAEKLQAVLDIDPIVEDFLWQESTIVLSKLLVPQIFETMSMQEMRALVAERSVMTIYSSGETVEVPEHSIGFLLEGCLKAQDTKAELITSPTALLPSCGDLSFLRSEPSGSIVEQALYSHQGSWYGVGTRVRVVIFDIAAALFKSGIGYQTRSSSLVQSGIPTSEHAGHMRWPGLVRRDHQRNNFSAKAMQLSIYGTVVKETHGSATDLPSSSTGGRLDVDSDSTNEHIVYFQLPQ